MVLLDEDLKDETSVLCYLSSSCLCELECVPPIGNVCRLSPPSFLNSLLFPQRILPLNMDLAYAP